MGGSLSTLVGGKSVPARTLPDSFGLVPRLAPARAHPPLNLTPCHYMLYAWHPQGPIHPQPHPVPLHVVHPCSHARRAVVWWRGGSLKCSGTGWRGEVVGPLRVPGLTVPRLTASTRAATLLPTTRPLPSNAPFPPPAPRQSDRATAQPEARVPASNGASTPQRSPGGVAKYFLVLECSAPATNAPQPRAAPTTP